MMINKRLINMVGKSKKYIAANVAAQWVSLAANITMMTAVTSFSAGLLAGTPPGQAGAADGPGLAITAAIMAGAAAIRAICSQVSAKMGYLSSKTVKKTMREKIYGKMLKLGASYNTKVRTSEVVQVAVEGAEQLETYFGAYLPQFFYAMAAPLTLFIYLSTINLPSAVVLLVCVPLIPAAIAAVQTWAKRLLSRYWDQYTALGDTFLENLQGLTTLKIYRSDGYKNDRMNEEAEKFRKITMKVLTMQLNSIVIMDLIAYGGAAAGVIMAVTQLTAGNVDLAGCLLIIMLSADFFIPMRQLGSFFHVAMNGMAAGDKIFALLDLPEAERKGQECGEDLSVRIKDLSFSYDGRRKVLKDINMEFPAGTFTAIVGESGCGKSTIASLIMGRLKDYTGQVTVGNNEIRSISEESLMKNFTYISHQSYIFKGTVRDNLIMACPGASDGQMWHALEKVGLDGFLKEEKGLDTVLKENGANFSGGQRQRLALARAMLHDSFVYIFDEATSNIDVESENQIMAQIKELAETKTVILISHRLANVTEASRIYVMERGQVKEESDHQSLIRKGGVYARLWNAQQELEKYGGETDA